jgi:hypothetical protein
MNKFNDIINNYKKNLSEATNTTMDKAVDDLENALKTSGTLSSNANARDLASKLFDIPLSNDPVENSLKTVFDKIKENPNNPNITDQERELIISIVSKTKPEENKEKEETSNSEEQKKVEYSKSTATPTQPSQQPNAKQYNPLNQ